MSPIDLSPEQQRVLDPEIRVIEAGPGSGKTRALIGRLVQQAAVSRQGIALLSFTNAAVDEVRRRAADAPHLRQAPHYVGTIDSFLHRFIVTPAEVSRLHRTPTYCQSWDELTGNITEVRINGVAGAGIRLDCFGLNQQDQGVINEASLTWRDAAYLKLVEDSSRRNQLLNVAGARLRGLRGQGIYDAASARVKAFAVLNSADGQAVVRRLTVRFAELLIDEAQDCDEAEMGIIRRLAAVMPVTVVADPDQAIYEFRGSRPQLFLDYRNEHPLDQRHQLATNFRSTDSICRAVTALRAAGGSRIMSHDPRPSFPVLVFSGTVSEQRDKFLNAVEETGLHASQAAVLAHRLSDAQAVAGSRSLEPSKRAVGNRLAVTCAVIREEGAVVKRVEAIRQVERIMLSIIAWSDDLRNAGVTRQLDALGRSPAWLRLAAGTTISTLLAIDDRDQFGVRAREVMGELLECLPIGHLSLSAKVKKPDQDIWDSCMQAQDAALLAASTVHAAKGCEYPAVLVALPNQLRPVDNRTVLDDWEGGHNSEPRRVLYVAASRAQLLLAFGAGNHHEKVAALLAAADVPVEVR